LKNSRFFAVGAPLEAFASPDESNYTFSNLHPSTLYDIAVTTVSNNMQSMPIHGKQVTGN